jgi:sugar phosphate isomerase/epimerase
MTSPATTRTGSFPIGCRLASELAKKSPRDAAAWALPQGLSVIDLYAAHTPQLAEWQAAGFTVGTLDLFGAGANWTDMLSADAGKRRHAVAHAAQLIRAATAVGVNKFFTLMLAEDVKLKRRETFNYMVESYGQLTDVLKETGGRIAIEGWPGCNAHCCNPESYRAFLQAMNSDSFGINFDPSHLIRMGIDPVRFLEEFGHRVVHMHGKDTWLDAGRIYDIGREQDAVFAEGLPWGGWFWRYTIPGHGVAPWTKLFEALVRAGYRGAVSIELEDMNFNGTDAGEQRGFCAGRDFLQTA